MFIKYIREYFHKVRTKGKEGSRGFTKCLLLHDVIIGDIIEISKEELNE